MKNLKINSQFKNLSKLKQQLWYENMYLAN